MKSNLAHHRAKKTAVVADSQLRKSLLIWSLLLVGILLTGQMVRRRPKYLNEKSIANGLTPTAINLARPITLPTGIACRVSGERYNGM
jgi:hypothetical protein